MKNPILAALFQQNLWANLSLIDVLEPLGERAKTMIVEGVFADPYSTMVHVIGSETSYLSRIAEAGDAIPWERGERPDWSRLRSVAIQSGEAFTRVAESVEGDPIQRGEYRGAPYAMPTSLLLIQAYNHGVDHRSQVKSILTHYGVPFPELDGWTWSESLA